MLLAVVSWESFAQLTANGIFRGAAYGLLGAGFALILGVTGRFHFAYSLTYTLSAYMCFTFWDRVGLPFWPASILGILVVSASGPAIERFVYRPLAARAGATALLAVFVASLGIGIAGENMIRLLWSSSSQAFYGPTQSVWTLWDGKITFLNFDIYQSVSALALVLILAAVLRFTSLGRRIKATRVNPDLATVIGIDAKAVYLIVFAIGSLFAAVAAFWYGLQFTVDPSIGQRPVIFAFVVAFLAGTASSPIRVFIAGIAVGLVEKWSSMFISVRWTETVVFLLLLGYLVGKSLKGNRFIASLRPHRLRPRTA
ncbi:MAG TPA: branched-chain amino acid ABC transporter permease [Acidimicrobiales bacterium]